MELRTEELSCSAMQLDKVELCDRAINVGRPKDYIEPPPGARPVAALGAAQVPPKPYPPPIPHFKLLHPQDSGYNLSLGENWRFAQI